REVAVVGIGAAAVRGGAFGAHSAMRRSRCGDGGSGSARCAGWQLGTGAPLQCVARRCALVSGTGRSGGWRHRSVAQRCVLLSEADRSGGWRRRSESCGGSADVWERLADSGRSGGAGGDSASAKRGVA
ncbi:unnamed protein product, partial [Phaeothamnion confervicola]